MKIRACHPYNFKRLVEFDKEKNSWDGITGDLAQSSLSLFLNKMRTQLLNVSVEIQAENVGVGEYREELRRYDGCLGQIQMNQSDLMMQLNTYPLDIENVDQGMILFETSLTFASGYNKTVLGESLQVLDSIYAFSGDLWLLCLFTWFTLSMFLSVEELLYQWVRRLLGLRRKKSTSSLYQVGIHLMRWGEIQHNRFTRRLMFMTASLFSLVVVQYFCSFIKTELVVVKDPVIFNSYQDIIDRKAIPLFVRGMSYDSLFKQSNSRPHRRKLWKYATKTFEKERLYMQLSPYLFLLVAVSVARQNVVVILEEAIIPVVITSGCSLAGRDINKMTGYMSSLRDPDAFEKQMRASGVMDEEEMTSFMNYIRVNTLDMPNDLLVHTSTDPKDEKFNQGLVLNSNGDEKLLRVMKWAARGLIEVGLTLEKRASIQQIDLFSNHQVLNLALGPPLSERRSEVENCRSKSIVKPTVKMQALKLDNMRTLFIIISAVYSLGGLLLALEIVARKLDKLHRFEN